MDKERLRRVLGQAGGAGVRDAAVLVPLLPHGEGFDVLFEVRALSLDAQPGEVCLPGGTIEGAEAPLQAAIRETCEELLVDEAQLEPLGRLGTTSGPGGRALHAHVALLHDYRGSFSPAEVERTFSMPLSWFMEHEPERYPVSYVPRYPEDFPWDLVPGGREYPWRASTSSVPFYRGSEPLIWGATARVIDLLTRTLRD